MGYHNTQEKILPSKYSNIMLLLLPGNSFASFVYICTYICTYISVDINQQKQIMIALTCHYVESEYMRGRCVTLNVNKQAAAYLWPSHGLGSIQ